MQEEINDAQRILTRGKARSLLSLPPHPSHHAQQEGHCYFLGDSSCQCAASLPCCQSCSRPEKGAPRGCGNQACDDPPAPGETSAHLGQVHGQQGGSIPNSQPGPCWRPSHGASVYRVLVGIGVQLHLQGWSQGSSLLSTHHLRQEGSSEGSGEGGTECLRVLPLT